ncbi:hypothetical protein Q604_UNBC14325G0001, partial [human gut metagenome]
ETISVPLKDWNKLKTNLIEADASIKSSNLSLNEAQSLTVKQATELQELKIINEERYILHFSYISSPLFNQDHSNVPHTLVHQHERNLGGSSTQCHRR